MATNGARRRPAPLKQQFQALTRCLRRRRPPPRASVTGGDDDLDAANAREDSGKNLSTVTGDRSCFPFHLLLLAFTRSTVHSKQRQRVLKTLPVTTNTCFYYRKGLGFGGEQSSLSPYQLPINLQEMLMQSCPLAMFRNVIHRPSPQKFIRFRSHIYIQSSTNKEWMEH